MLKKMGALVLATTALLGCEDSLPTPPAAGVEPLRIVSFPVRNGQTGQPLGYGAALSRAGAATWTLTQAPAGAAIDAAGNLGWTPAADQGGTQAFSVHAQLGGESVDQAFSIEVATVTVETTQTIDPANPNGGTVAVDAPLSPIRGSAVVIGPGALAPGSPVDITISSVKNAPVPISATLGGLGADDLKPVELGPSGTAFARPVQIVVPVSQAVLDKGPPTVQTFDYTTGRWEKVKVVSVDAANRLVTAEVSHFSLYVAAPDSQFFDLQLTYGGAGTSCASALAVRAPP